MVRGSWWRLLAAPKRLGAFTNWANSVDLWQRPFAERNCGAVGTVFERIGQSRNKKLNFWWTLRARGSWWLLTAPKRLGDLMNWATSVNILQLPFRNDELWSSWDSFRDVWTIPKQENRFLVDSEGKKHQLVALSSSKSLKAFTTWGN
jgi:hypothetical protein